MHTRTLFPPGAFGSPPHTWHTSLTPHVTLLSPPHVTILSHTPHVAMLTLYITISFLSHTH